MAEVWGSIYKVEFLDWDGTVISQTGFTNPQYVEDGKSATPPQTDPVRKDTPLMDGHRIIIMFPRI